MPQKDETDRSKLGPRSDSISLNSYTQQRKKHVYNLLAKQRASSTVNVIKVVLTFAVHVRLKHLFCSPVHVC